MAVAPNPYARQNAVRDKYKAAQDAQNAYKDATSRNDRGALEKMKADQGMETTDAYTRNRLGQATNVNDLQNIDKERYQFNQQGDSQLGDSFQRRLDSLKQDQHQAFLQDSQDAIANMTPERLQAEQFTNPGQLQEFEAQRNRFMNQSQGQAMTNQNAMTRRFAAMGNLNSGAALKQESLARDQQAQAQNEGISNINAAESGAIRQMDEAVKGRNAARDQYNSEQEFKTNLFKFDANSKLAQFDAAMDETEWQHKMDTYNQSMNAQMIEMSKPSTFDKIMNGIGSVAGAVTGLGGLFKGSGSSTPAPTKVGSR